MRDKIDWNQYWCPAGLKKQRGWTDKMIKQFLPAEPDHEAQNPHYRHGIPMRLYLRSRILGIERRKAFKAFVAQNQGRVAGARKAVETKEERTLATVRGWTISLKVMLPDELSKRALQSYNSHQQDRAMRRQDQGRDYDEPNEAKLEGCEPAFLQRITVNFLRHNLTSYEEKLERLYGKIGTKKAYIALNKKIYDKIAEIYPHLADECRQQLDRKTKEQEEWT